MMAGVDRYRGKSPAEGGWVLGYTTGLVRYFLSLDTRHETGRARDPDRRLSLVPVWARV
jgi:hypothetical protein